MQSSPHHGRWVRHTQTSNRKMRTIFCFFEYCTETSSENVSYHIQYSNEMPFPYQLVLQKYTVCVLLLQHTEALLYGFQSIAETIDVNYSDVIPGLIGLIPRISINNVQLADTVMFTIGETSFMFGLKGSQHTS